MSGLNGHSRFVQPQDVVLVGHSPPLGASGLVTVQVRVFDHDFVGVGTDGHDVPRLGRVLNAGIAVGFRVAGDGHFAAKIARRDEHQAAVVVDGSRTHLIERGRPERRQALVLVGGGDGHADDAAAVGCLDFDLGDRSDGDGAVIGRIVFSRVGKDFHGFQPVTKSDGAVGASRSSPRCGP